MMFQVDTVRTNKEAEHRIECLRPLTQDSLTLPWTTPSTDGEEA